MTDISVPGAGPGATLTVLPAAGGGGGGGAVELWNLIKTPGAPQQTALGDWVGPAFTMSEDCSYR